MSTFVVYFVADPTETFQGRVRHVSTGEETVFSSIAELLAFFEGMTAVNGLGSGGEKISEPDVEPDARSSQSRTTTSHWKRKAES